MAAPPSEKRLATMLLTRILLLPLILHVNATGLRGSSSARYESPLQIDEKTLVDCQQQANSGSKFSQNCEELIREHQTRALRRRRNRRANIFNRGGSTNPGITAGSSQGGPKGGKGGALLRSKHKGATTASPTTSGTAFPSILSVTAPPAAPSFASIAPTTSQTVTISPTSGPVAAANFQTAAPTTVNVDTVQPAVDAIQTSTPTTSAVTPWSLAPQPPSYNIFSRTHAPTRSPVFPPSGILPSFSQVTFAPSSQTAIPAPTLSSPITATPVLTSTTAAPTHFSSTTAPTKSVVTSTVAPSPPPHISPSASVPSLPPQETATFAPKKVCQLKNGNFGSLTGASTNVTYQYQVQPLINTTAAEIQANILPGTKSNLSAQLLPLLFPATCENPNANATKRLRRRTQEGFTGISSHDPDKIVGTVTCANTSCFIVNGTVTLYASGNITTDMVNTASGKIQDIISSGALNGASDKVNLLSSNDGPTNNAKSPAPVASNSSVAGTPLYGWIIIGVGGFISVLGFFAVRWRLGSKDHDITGSGDEKFADYEYDDHEVDADEHDMVRMPSQTRKPSSVVDTDDDDYEDDSPVSPRESQREFTLGPSLVSPAMNGAATIMSEKTSKSTGQHSNILHADDEVGAAAMAAGAAMAADAAGSIIHAGDDLSWGLHDDDELTEEDEEEEEEEESWEEEEEQEEDDEEEEEGEEEEDEVIEEEEEDEEEVSDESWERGFVQNPETRGGDDLEDEEEDDEEDDDDEDEDEEDYDDDEEEDEEDDEALTLGKLQTNHRPSDFDDEVSYDDEDDSFDDDDEFAEGTLYGQESRDISGSLSEESQSEEDDYDDEGAQEEEEDYEDEDEDDAEEDLEESGSGFDNIAVFAAAGMAVSSNASANKTESTQSGSANRTESTQSRSNGSTNKTGRSQNEQVAINPKEASWEDSGEWDNQPFPSSDEPTFFAFGGSHHQPTSTDNVSESEPEDSHGEEYWKEEQFWDDGGDEERRSPRKRRGGRIPKKSDEFQVNDGNNLSDDEKNLWELTTPAPDELKSFGSYGRKKGEDESRRHSTGAFSAGSLNKLNKLPAGAVTEDGNVVSTEIKVIDARSAPERLDGRVQTIHGKGQGPSNVSISDGWMQKEGNKTPVSPSVDADLDWADDPFKASQPKQPFKIDQVMRARNAEPTIVGFMQQQSGWPIEMQEALKIQSPSKAAFQESPQASASRGNSSRGSQSQTSKGLSGLPEGVFPFGMGEAVDRLLQELSDSDSYSEYDSKDSQLFDEDESIEDEDLTEGVYEANDVNDYDNSHASDRDGKPEDSESSHTEPQGEDFDKSEVSENNSVDDAEQQNIHKNYNMPPHSFPGADELSGHRAASESDDATSNREQESLGSLDEEAFDEPEREPEEDDDDSRAQSQSDNVDDSAATENRSVDEAQQRLSARRNGNPLTSTLPGEDNLSQQGSEDSESQVAQSKVGSDMLGFDNDEFKEPFEGGSDSEQDDDNSHAEPEIVDDDESYESEERSIDHAQRGSEVSVSQDSEQHGDNGDDFYEEEFQEPFQAEASESEQESEEASEGDVGDGEFSEDASYDDAEQHFNIKRTGNMIPGADDLSGQGSKDSESHNSHDDDENDQIASVGIDHDGDSEEEEFEEPFEAADTDSDQEDSDSQAVSQAVDIDESEASQDVSDDDDDDDTKQNFHFKQTVNTQTFKIGNDNGGDLEEEEFDEPFAADETYSEQEDTHSQAGSQEVDIDESEDVSDDDAEQTFDVEQRRYTQAFNIPEVDDLSEQNNSKNSGSQNDDYQNEREREADDDNDGDSDDEFKAPFDAEESGSEQDQQEDDESEVDEDPDDGYADHRPDEKHNSSRQALAFTGMDDSSGRDSQGSESEESEENEEEPGMDDLSAQDSQRSESEANEEETHEENLEFEDDEFEEPFQASDKESEHDDNESQAESQIDDDVEQHNSQDEEESASESVEDNRMDESSEGEMDDEPDDIESDEGDQQSTADTPEAFSPSRQRAYHQSRNEMASDEDSNHSNVESDDEHEGKSVDEANSLQHDDDSAKEEDSDVDEGSAHVVTDHESEEESENHDETEGSKDDFEEHELFAEPKTLNTSGEMEFNQDFESSDHSFGDEDPFCQDKGDGFSSFTSFGKRKSFVEEEKVDDFGGNPFGGFGNDSKEEIKFSEVATKGSAETQGEHDGGDRSKWISSVWGIVDSEEDVDDGDRSAQPSAASSQSTKPEARVSSPIAEHEDGTKEAIATTWLASVIGVDEDSDEDAGESEFAFKDEAISLPHTLPSRQAVQSSWFSDDMGQHADDFQTKSPSQSKGFDSTNSTSSQEASEGEEEDSKSSFNQPHTGIQVPTKQAIVPDGDDSSDNDDDDETQDNGETRFVNNDDNELSPKASPQIRHSQLNRTESNPSLEGDESFYDEQQEDDEEEEEELEDGEDDEESAEEDDEDASFEESSYESAGFHIMETVPEASEEDATTHYESGDNLSINASERTRSEHVTSFMITDGPLNDDKAEVVSASERSEDDEESEESEVNEDMSVERSEVEEQDEEEIEDSRHSHDEEDDEMEELEEEESEEFEEGSDQEDEDDGYCGSFNGSHEYLEPVLEESDEDVDESEENESRATVQGSTSDMDEASDDERSVDQVSERESDQGSVDDEVEESAGEDGGEEEEVTESEEDSEENEVEGEEEYEEEEEEESASCEYEEQEDEDEEEYEEGSEEREVLEYEEGSEEVMADDDHEVDDREEEEEEEDEEEEEEGEEGDEDEEEDEEGDEDEEEEEEEEDDDDDEDDEDDDTVAMEEAMAAMTDPEVMAEMAKIMMDDPEFQAQLAALDPSYVSALAEMMKDA